MALKAFHALTLTCHPRLILCQVPFTHYIFCLVRILISRPLYVMFSVSRMFFL